MNDLSRTLTEAGPVRHAKLRQLTDHMLIVLVEAQKQRTDPAMQLYVDTANGPEFGWVLHERASMWQAVNLARKELGLAPVDVEAVCRAERQAEGHSDYSRKWAFACAELILEQP